MMWTDFETGLNQVVNYLLKKVPTQTNMVEMDEPNNNNGMYIVFLCYANSVKG